MENYYQILGVSETATLDEIKKSYRNLVKIHHPDKGGNEEEFKKISAAYDILSDPDKRSKYDNERKFGQPGLNFGFDNDIFNNFFSRFYGKSTQAQTIRGDDLRITLSLTLSEILNGVDKKIKYKRKTTCVKCNGSGAKDSNSIVNCGQCGGNGRITEIFQTMFGGMSQVVKSCPSCSGSGKKVSVNCAKCTGHGVVDSEETFDLSIPPGVVAQMEFRLGGKGNFPRESGMPGDLLILIAEEEDSDFIRVNNNLHTDLFLSIPEILLGNDEVKVPTLEGEVLIKIPPGTEPGKIFRIKEKGLPTLNQENNKGDLYVHINIFVPSTLKEEDKKAIEKLRSKEVFKPTKDKLKNIKGAVKKAKELNKILV